MDPIMIIAPQKGSLDSRHYSLFRRIGFTYPLVTHYGVGRNRYGLFGIRQITEGGARQLYLRYEGVELPNGEFLTAPDPMTQARQESNPYFWATALYFREPTMTERWDR
jgi:hypothetical protein